MIQLAPVITIKVGDHHMWQLLDDTLKNPESEWYYDVYSVVVMSPLIYGIDRECRLVHIFSSRVVER